MMAALLSLTFAAFAEEQPAQGQFVNYDRFIGREAVTGNRGLILGLNRPLPLSCPPFKLLDADGNPINPKMGPDGKPILPKYDKDGNVTNIAELRFVGNPVSMKKTCGQCHEYDKITHGYHFQMGRDQLFPAIPEDRSDAEKLSPASQGPGYFGKWHLLYQRQLTPWNVTDPKDADMSPFEWVTECGICHPGGGPAEYDRTGQRYDEALRKDIGGLTAFGNGDYMDQAWMKTGVLEADCFICHLEEYDYSIRVQELKKYNFKFTATAAANLAFIFGSVREGQEPKAYYKTDIFRPDGTVLMHIRRPSDRQCLACHNLSNAQKRGGDWHNSYVQDAHTQQGIRCIDCHHGDIRHNFQKGSPSGQSVREDLDNTMLSCAKCHEDGEKGAPGYEKAHRFLPPLHLERIDCTACHITHRPFLPAGTVDTLTGIARQTAISPSADEYDDRAFGAAWGYLAEHSSENLMVSFTPAEIERAKNYVIAENSDLRKLFTDTRSEGEGTSSVCRLPAGAFTVGGLMEQSGGAESDDARMLMLLALQQTQGAQSPICVFRGKAEQMDATGLKPVKIKLQPKRPGAAIAETPYQLARAKNDGKIYPVSRQLGAFWAYVENDEAKPLFLSDMDAAWKFLTDPKFKRYEYKGPPASGVASPALPPADEALRQELLAFTPETLKKEEAAKKALQGAINAKLKAYTSEDRRELTVYDDNNDSFPEANTDEEIGLVAWALKTAVPRLADRPLYYIRGEKVFQVTIAPWYNPFDDSNPAWGEDYVPMLDMERIGENEPFMAIQLLAEKEDGSSGKSSWGAPTKSWQPVEIRLARPIDATVEVVDPSNVPTLAALAQPLDWTASHGVEPVGRALGAHGCSDCHSADAPFFFGTVPVDPFDEGGTPATVSQAAVLGYNGQPRKYTGAPGLTNTFFNWFTVAVIGALIGHMGMDSLTRLRTRKTRKHDSASAEMVQRFNGHFLVQHFVLMSSVMTLILTAVPLFALRFPGAHWAGVMTSALGGVDLWRVIHRCGASGLIFVCVYHHVYSVIHREGRRDFMLMMPRPKDFAHLAQNLLWFFGIRKTPPNFGRFSYVEKFDYWAVFWGCAIMVGTGLAMWFPAVVRAVVPHATLEFWDTVKEAHAHEAILAALAIIIWHFYNVHYRPGRFPGSLTFLHGRITRHEMEEEHPAELESMPPKGADGDGNLK